MGHSPGGSQKAWRKSQVCGDFKVTLNPALKKDVYLFPLPEKLFYKQRLTGSFG